MKTRRLFLAALCGVAMIVGTSSCKKEKNENENLGEEMRIAASLGIPDGGQKTHLDGTSVKWDSDDSFMLYSGSNGASFRIEPGEAGGTSATFVGTRPGAAPFYACYPSDATQTADGFTYTVSNDQSNISTVNAGPMAAYYTGSGNLTFENVMSWLNIGLKGDATVTKVELTDKSGSKLYGTLKVTMDGDKISSVEMTGDATNTTLFIKPTKGVTLNPSTPTYFQFLVPAGAFKGDNKVEIKVTVESGCQTTLTKSFGDNGVIANKIYNAVVSDEITKPEYVDLGLSVLWAIRNVGAGVQEEYGDYFAWGETKPKDVYNWTTYSYGNPNIDPNFPSLYFEGGETTLRKGHDGATVNWDEPWRMPTYDEMRELVNPDNCTWEYKENYNDSGHNGFLITSKIAGYEGNSIFLPAANIMSDNPHDYTQLHYWTSDLASGCYNQGAYALHTSINLDGNEIAVFAGSRQDGRTVRPVRPKN